MWKEVSHDESRVATAIAVKDERRMKGEADFATMMTVAEVLVPREAQEPRSDPGKEWEVEEEGEARLVQSQAVLP